MRKDFSPHPFEDGGEIEAPRLGEVVIFPVPELVPESELPTDPFDRQSILSGLVDGYFTDPERDIIVDAVLQHRLDALKSPIPRFISRDQLVNWLKSEEGPKRISLWFDLVKPEHSDHEQLSMTPWLEANRDRLRDEYDDGLAERAKRYTNVVKVTELALLSRNAHPLTQEWRDNGQISKPIREDETTYRVDINDPAEVLSGLMDIRIPGKKRLPPGQARSILLMSWLQHHEREIGFGDPVVSDIGAVALAEPEFQDEIYFEEVVSHPFKELPVPARPDEMFTIRGLTPKERQILTGMTKNTAKGVWFRKESIVRVEDGFSDSSLIRVVNKLLQTDIFQHGEYGYRFLVHPEQIASTEIIELDAPKSPDTPEQGVLLDISDIIGSGQLDIARQVIEQALSMGKEWFGRGDFSLVTDKLSDERTIDSAFSIIAKHFIRSGLFAYRGESSLRKYKLTARPTAIEVSPDALIGPLSDGERQTFGIDTAEFDEPVNVFIVTSPKPPSRESRRRTDRKDTPQLEPERLPPPAPPMPAVGVDQILAQLDPDQIEMLTDDAFELIYHWSSRNSTEASVVALADGLRGGSHRGITVGDTRKILDELIDTGLVELDGGKYRIQVPEEVVIE